MRSHVLWHLRTLISAFVVRWLVSILSILMLYPKFQRLQLGSVIKQAGLILSWSHTS